MDRNEAGSGVLDESNIKTILVLRELLIYLAEFSNASLNGYSVEVKPRKIVLVVVCSGTKVMRNSGSLPNFETII